MVERIDEIERLIKAYIAVLNSGLLCSTPNVRLLDEDWGYACNVPSHYAERMVQQIINDLRIELGNLRFKLEIEDYETD